MRVDLAEEALKLAQEHFNQDSRTRTIPEYRIRVLIAQALGELPSPETLKTFSIEKLERLRKASQSTILENYMYEYEIARRQDESSLKELTLSEVAKMKAHVLKHLHSMYRPSEFDDYASEVHRMPARTIELLYDAIAYIPSISPQGPKPKTRRRECP